MARARSDHQLFWQDYTRKLSSLTNRKAKEKDKLNCALATSCGS